MNSLNIGYSGLSAAQVGIDVTGHNITNAETEGYSRQRVIQSAATPVTTGAGNVGNGVDVQDISRVFDNYVFDSYRGISGDKEYSDYERQQLEELSSYFPEVDGVGIKSDMADYYDMWQSLADNPDNDAVKTALAQQTQTLTNHIQSTRAQVSDLQMKVNDQLETDINQVNDLAQQLADINKAIDKAESGDMYIASDLRDKRNVLERDLTRLVGAEVNQGNLNSNIEIDSNSNIRTGSYTVSVNGYNIVDGATVHPLKVSKENNPSGFYEISYERQDGVLIPLEEKIDGGRVGAIFDLRGRTVDTTTGMPNDGIIQTTLSDLDAFAKGLIETTNNLYAKAPTQRMDSNSLTIGGDDPLVNSGYNIKEGSFNMVVYDVDGNEVATREVMIDNATSLSGDVGSNSIEGQIKDNKDDNDDNNATNDIDDYIQFGYQTAADGQQILSFSLTEDALADGYTFSIEDNLQDDSFDSGTNFAGAFGLGRYFDGNNAKDIDLNFSLKQNPSEINAGYTSADGDNQLALDMVQQQYEEYTFKTSDTTSQTSTLYSMFDTTVTYVGISTNSAITRNDTVTAQFNATEMEYNSVSKVNTDEEMTNLIKYQNSYGASAKLITTIDQMMKTLLGIKQ
jgi:flagellar hook-associated protein 1 FlgK